jgi:hypothetical protein
MRIGTQDVRHLGRFDVHVHERTSSPSPTCSHSSGRSMSEYSTLYRSNSLKPSSEMLISTVLDELATRLSELSHSLTFCTVNTSGSISSCDQREEEVNSWLMQTKTPTGSHRWIRCGGHQTKLALLSIDEIVDTS